MRGSEDVDLGARLPAFCLTVLAVTLDFFLMVNVHSLGAKRPTFTWPARGIGSYHSNLDRGLGCMREVGRMR